MLQLLRAGAIQLLSTDTRIGGVTTFVNNSAVLAGGESQELPVVGRSIKCVNAPGNETEKIVLHTIM